MYRRFRTEVTLTNDQFIKLKQTIGVCRYVYNLFLAQNKKWYEQGMPYKNAKEFSVWLNRDYLPSNPDKQWIKSVSSKSVKQALEQAHTAYQRFFKKQSGFPRFKKKERNEVSMYFVRNHASDIISCDRHRIKVPTLGWIHFKEYGYVPTTASGNVITSGTLFVKAGRVYVSCVVDLDPKPNDTPFSDGIGIDLGVQMTMTVSDGRTFENINKQKKLRKLKKRLKHLERSLAKKYEYKKKGGSAFVSNHIKRIKGAIQRLYQRITNIQTDYLKKAVATVVKTKPRFVVLEDLNVRGMIKNRHLAKAIQDQKFYTLRQLFQTKCMALGIELRIANRWVPSSKRCHACGTIKNDLRLSDRVFQCPCCGVTIDRDLNASLNLRDTSDYVTQY